MLPIAIPAIITANADNIKAAEAAASRLLLRIITENAGVNGICNLL